MIKEILQRVDALDKELATLALREDDAAKQLRATLQRARTELLSSCVQLSASDKVFLARHPKRPKIDDYIDALFTDFFVQKGDRQCREDESILGGVALYKGVPVTVIGHKKGRDLPENLALHFGMAGPEGYRKALRLMKQAEKFNRPIITFIDTPGAYPGLEAEERGQGEAIARNLAEMSQLNVPVIAIVTGEGSSGGALALGVANHVLMLEHAIYSVLSPEGFASILWKDAARHGEACEMMKLTAQDLKTIDVIEEIIPEPAGGAQADPERLFACVDTAIEKHLAQLHKQSGRELIAQRYKKFRAIGA